MSAPAFENADRCRRCNCTFGLITRKHHCRNCGRTFCGPCSSKSQSLPHFGISESVRVCDECDDSLKGGVKPKAASSRPESSSSPPASSSSSSSSSSNGQGSDSKVSGASKSRVKVCKCNMPLCVCPPDAEEVASKSSSTTNPSSTATTASKPRAAASSSSSTSSSSTTSSSFQGFGGFSGFSSSASREWDLNGDKNEQLREALKAGDNAGAFKLLNAGADAQYVDKTGNSLLHMAAMFNRGELVTELIKRGADPQAKNPAGETPIDLAPPALAHKIKQMQ